MPTYTVMAAAGRLTDPQKREIARDITRVHSEATGAQGFFARVIFQASPAGDHSSAEHRSCRISYSSKDRLIDELPTGWLSVVPRKLSLQL